MFLKTRREAHAITHEQSYRYGQKNYHDDRLFHSVQEERVHHRHIDHDKKDHAGCHHVKGHPAQKSAVYLLVTRLPSRYAHQQDERHKRQKSEEYADPVDRVSEPVSETDDLVREHIAVGLGEALQEADVESLLR